MTAERAHPDRAAIESGQLQALRDMIRALIPDNRFYTTRLKQAGLAGGPDGLADFFARMPFTTKQELVNDQLANPPYGTNLTFPVERYVRYNQTSGTSGAALRWLDTAESWNWMVDRWAQVFHSSGVDSGDRVFFAFSFGPFLGFWTAFDAAARIGCLCLPGGGMSSAARLRSIMENGATVLCCTPTYAIRLGEVAVEEGLDPSTSVIRTIIVAGEPGGGIPAVRARIERLWPGAKIKDHHGMTETGPVTFECPARPGVLHVMESAYIPEVIDPETGRHAQPGETGELVLTNLGRIGSPLIRYRTGDLVRRAATEPCACSLWDLALEGGIIGRTDDMVVVRGVNVHPSAIEEIIRRFESVAEYQVIQTTEQAMTGLRIRLEPLPNCPDPARLAREVEAALRTALNLRIPVATASAGSLPRFEMKAHRWVRESSS